MGRYDEDDTREAASKAEYSSLKDAINLNDDVYALPDRTSFFASRPLCGMWGGPRVWAIRRPSDRCGIILISIALVLGILTACGPVIVDKLVESGIDAQTVLKGPKGKAFSTFVESGDNIGVEIFYALRYLNLTNPTEVLAGTAKARLEEVGPFVYRQYRNKLNVTFAEDGETVSFILKKTYMFDEAANADTGLVDTQAMITTVHPVIQVLQGQLKNTLNVHLTELLQPSAEGWLAPFRRSVERQIEASGLWKAVYKLVLCQGNPMGVSPFTTQTARDLYWGYHGDSVLHAMQTLVNAIEGLAAKINKEIALPVVPEAFPGLQPNLTSEAETFRRIGPNIVYTGQGTTKARLQEYTMFQNMTSVRACPDPTTGAIPEEDEMPSCDVYQAEWGNRSAARHGYMPQWGSEAANQVRGTDGSLFAHPLTGKDTVVTFQEDYRRWVEMVYLGEVSDFHGLPLRRYVFSQEDFRNDSAMASDFYQENLPMGLCNLTLMGGFPLYLSKPHLLEAEPLVQEAVEGLHPDPERHLTFIDAEERSGVTFRTHKRVQLNAGLERLHFPSLSRWQAGGLATMLKMTLNEREGRCMREEVTWDFGLPEAGGRDGEAVEAEWMRMLFLPMVIYDESFQMSPSFTSDFKHQVLGSVSVAKTTQVAGPLFAVVLLLVGVLVMVRGRRKERELAERRTQRYSTMQEGDILV
ncbi:lysosome membrane protein 2 [Nannochloropsis oceanica]